jgi:uncharacterized protein
MPAAVGTSLLVIAINSATALAARLGNHVHLDWPLLAAFTAAAIAGSLAGNRVASQQGAGDPGTGDSALLIVYACRPVPLLQPANSRATEARSPAN